MRITDRACIAAAVVALSTPAVAMDDQATYWRFDGRADKRISGVGAGHRLGGVGLDWR